MQSNPYTIRYVRPDELAILPAIERAAAIRFRATSYAYLADDDPLSADVNLEHDFVWVVVDADDQPVGFAIVHVFDDEVYLHEIDVHPQHAGQGLGRRLIETVTEWARTRGMTALTLTTFADVAWNGPYYARLGFRILDETELSRALQQVRQEEAASGLPMAQRICMQLDL